MKQRHGCLTAYLIVMIIANALVGLSYIFGGGAFADYSNYPTWIILVLGIISFANVAGAVALFLWKKWGFYLFIASSLVVFVFNLIAGADIMTSLLGLVGIAFLYGVLQIGTENKGWPQLE
jgi:hypothetical protein